MEDDRRSSGHSRRTFLTGVGGAAGVAIGAGTLAPDAASGFAGPGAAAPEVPRTQRFGRMFRDPPFADDSPQLQQALLEIGAPGGLMDAADALERGPVDLIVDPALSVNNPNNPTHTAGTTFMGQFMDHDVTFDPTTRLAAPAVPRDTKNFRTRPSISTSSTASVHSPVTASTTAMTSSSSRWSPAGCSRTCRGPATTAPSSPIRATTRT